MRRCAHRGPEGCIEVARPDSGTGNDGAGAAEKSQSQTFEVVRRCVRERVDPKDVGSVDWYPASGLDMEAHVWPS